MFCVLQVSSDSLKHINAAVSEEPHSYFSDFYQPLLDDYVMFLVQMQGISLDLWCRYNVCQLLW